MEPDNEWEREYNLTEARRHPSKRAEAAHQTQALAKLRAWYESAPAPDAGGLLCRPPAEVRPSRPCGSSAAIR